MGCGSSHLTRSSPAVSDVEQTLALGPEERTAHAALRRCASVFLAWDANADGVISRDEMGSALGAVRKKSGKYEPFVERCLFLYGCHVVGAPIRFEDFIRYTASFKPALNERPKGAYFGWRLLDFDGSGAVEAKELAFALGLEFMTDETPELSENWRGGGLGRENGRKTDVYQDRATSSIGVGLANAKGKAKGVASMMRELDVDNNGSLDLQEFRRLCQRYPTVFGVVWNLWNIIEPYIIPCDIIQQRLDEVRKAKVPDTSEPASKYRSVQSGKDEVMEQIRRLIEEAPSNQAGY